MKGGKERIWKDQRATFNLDSLASSSRKRDNEGNTNARNSDPIPLDLTIEILKRLPVKSLVRFRCISKLWASIISRRHFINSFLTRSSTRLSLLGIVHDYKDTYVFMAPHPKNHGEQSSSLVHHILTIPQEANSFMMPNYLRGLICFEKVDQIVICNPSTRQLVTLPKSKSESPAVYNHCRTWNHFGYDAVNDQYKVLCTSMDNTSELISEHRVFVLGAGNSWRRIECSVPHCPRMRGLCIDGVLYYGARTFMCMDGYAMVSFDIRSEKFNLIQEPVAVRDICTYLTMINYEGKVALVDYANLMTNDSFDLWTLEDAKKEKWSKMSCVLPITWRDFDGKMRFYVAGTIHTGEIILAPYFLLSSLYVLCYDIKRNKIRRVEFEGIEETEDALMHHKKDGKFPLHISTLSDHVENIMFL